MRRELANLPIKLVISPWYLVSSKENTKKNTKFVFILFLFLNF